MMQEFSKDLLAHLGVIGSPEDVVVPGLIDGQRGHAGEVTNTAEVEKLLVLLDDFAGIVGAPSLLPG